ncbi:Aminopeptidase N [Halomicronema hongdechloris C2206]|uniref:Aminopeptidase N n=1 Tax=Halomicronema hongdechloris C2206 TaxID=1641165 RepID=A0A1Z3HV56_9CYAN|nr:M1 family metallopeptidase [Halomicronema hongdechloris]ASC74179.1 Aminopeptidase N [Halomicronema hongdechloris C2206]
MLNIHCYTAADNEPNSFELPGARPHYNPDRPAQVDHIALDLALDIAQKKCSGTCSIRLNPIRNGVDRLTLDAVALEIQSLAVDGAARSFDHDGEELSINLPTPLVVDQPVTLTIAYRVEAPQRGMYFIGPDHHYPDKPVQVWTQGEDEDSRYWFPCFDYPGQLSTSEIRVKVPQPYQAVANGELVATEEEGDFKVYHWVQRQVHPTYLMALAVGNFDLIQDHWQAVPVTYHVDKGRQADAQRTLGKTPQMLAFFSQVFGYDYPYPKYAQVCAADFIFGGMENTSCTLLTDRCLLDERAALDNRNSEMLVAHELAHQWFGDLLVINHWSHAWIKEGMASYAEVLWTAHEYGADEANYYRLDEIRSYVSEDKSRYRRPMVTHVYREAIELYDGHIYEKGACVYHMIHQALGDELFQQAIHTFVRDNAHRTVETVDLIRAIDRATGRNLRPLFDQYVFRGGYPDYKVTYSWDKDSCLAQVTVTQTQAQEGKTGTEKGLFDLKMPIAFGYRDETGQVTLQSFTVRIHEQEQSFFFPLAKKPTFVSFDQGSHTLKTVTLNYPLPELKAQLQDDPDPLSRIDAADAIAKKGNLEAVRALATALESDPFWGVRAEVAEQLASVKLDQAVDSLINGLADVHPRVRRAVANALGQVKTMASYQALYALLDSGDPSYYVEAAAAEALGKVAATPLDGQSQQPQGLQMLEQVLQERAGWNETVRSGAIRGVSQFKTSEAALTLLMPYTQAGVPQPLRLTAIRALGKISTGQGKAAIERILDQLDLLSRETFFLTQVAVVSALGSMETPGAIKVLQSLADHTPDGRVRRRAEEAVQTVQKAIDKDEAVQTLQQEIDELKRANQDLKSRLESLEAKTKTNSSAG